MGKTFLICSSDDDQLDTVIQALTEKGTQNYFRFNADRIHLDYELSIYPNIQNFKLTELTTGNVITADSFTSVWYTEPEIADKKHGGIEDELYNYLSSEYQAAVEALIACFEFRGTTMVSSPSIISAVANKQRQQMIAQKVGFQLPKQLVTTQNQAFIQESWSKYAVLKALDSHKQMEEGAELPYTQFVHEALYEGIQSGDVSLEIHYFQERLNQLAEYRIICFGDEAYAFKITGDYEVDWRQDLTVITYDYIENFHSNKLCIKYLRKTGLNFGSFDLMETKDGIFFIECNSPGYFLFCDKSEEVGLAEKFAAYLVR